MPRLAANLSMLFSERPFLDRFGAAAACGFAAVEFLFPYDFPADEIAARLHAHGLANVLFNINPGDWQAGERGLAGLPGREQEFAETVEQAIAYARTLGCPRLHAMHGVPVADMAPEACRETFIGNLRQAAATAAEHGITIMVEALNTQDFPGYPLNRQEDAQAVVGAVGAPNVKVQFDFYHCQVEQGDVARRFRRVFDDVGHVQIAGVPGRHEPDRGGLDYTGLLSLADRLGYAGWVGCEYRPATATEAGLTWAAPYGIRAPQQ